jgi:hypothetical protein
LKNPTDEMVLIKTLGLTWYVKWGATVLVLIAVMCRSVDEIPKIYDVAFSWLGTLGWLYVGLQWKDRALIILNSVIGFLLFTSLVRYIVKFWAV